MTNIFINPREAENLFHIVSNALQAETTINGANHRNLLRGLATKFAAAGTTALHLNWNNDGEAKEELKTLVATAANEEDFIKYLSILNKWSIAN